MGSTKRQGILMGAALLGVGTVIGLSQVASAGPRREIKEERKEVKQARKEVRQADSPRERREARENLRDERQDVRREREAARVDRRYDSNRRYDYNRRYDTNRRYDYNRRYDSNRRYDYNRRYDSGRYNDRDYDYGRRSFNTVEGVVQDDFRGNGFVILTTSGIPHGRRLRVVSDGREPGRLSEGDRVRLQGYARNGVFHARNIIILRDRY